MDPISELLVPGALFFLMLVVGSELRATDFERLVRRPRTVLAGTLIQPLALPLLAGLLVLAYGPAPHLAAGLLLVACCPGGAISNSYVLIARVNPALSVTLTAIGSMLSVFTLPILITWSFRLFLGGMIEVEPQVLPMIGQLVLLLLLPIALGMAVRRYRPSLVEGREKSLRRISLLMVLAILALILVPELSAVGVSLSTVGLAVAFTVLAWTCGLLLGWLLRAPAHDRATLAIELAVRNLAVALFIATTALGQPRFAVFGAVFFVVQAPIVLGGTWLYTRLAATT